MPTDTTPNFAAIDFAQACAHDLEELVALRIAAMQRSLEHIGRFDPERARERFTEGFSPAHTEHILLGSTRIGFIVVKPCPDGLLLDHLYIREDYQKRGIGSLVLARIFALADTAELDVRVAALRESDANRFYARHGFEKVDEGPWDIYYVRKHRSSSAPSGS